MYSRYSNTSLIYLQLNASLNAQFFCLHSLLVTASIPCLDYCYCLHRLLVANSITCLLLHASYPPPQSFIFILFKQIEYPSQHEAVTYQRWKNQAGKLGRRNVGPGLATSLGPYNDISLLTESQEGRQELRRLQHHACKFESSLNGLPPQCQQQGLTGKKPYDYLEGLIQ